MTFMFFINFLEENPEYYYIIHLLHTQTFKLKKIHQHKNLEKTKQNLKIEIDGKTIKTHKSIYSCVN